MPAVPVNSWPVEMPLADSSSVGMTTMGGRGGSPNRRQLPPVAHSRYTRANSTNRLHSTMQYTIIELEKFLDELMMAAWSGEEVIITRNGKPIAQLVHRGPQIKLRTEGDAPT